MTLTKITALFGAMLVLAVLPSPSVFAVVAKSIASGFTQGLMTALGILAGDLLFILIAIYGLSAIAQKIGILLIFVKYLGSAYLIWCGVQLLRLQSKSLESSSSEEENTRESSLISGFLSGLLITLGDQKAILFYFSFFPAFLDLKNISIVDTITVIAIAIIAVGGTKIVYAYMADKAKLIFTSYKAKKRMNIAASIVMIGTGIILITKT